MSRFKISSLSSTCCKHVAWRRNYVIVQCESSPRDALDRTSGKGLWADGALDRFRPELVIVNPVLVLRPLLSLIAALLMTGVALAQHADDQTIEDPEVSHEKRPSSKGNPGASTDDEAESASEDFDTAEQIIRDPELSGVPMAEELLRRAREAEAAERGAPSAGASAETPEPSGGGGSLVIEDPELKGAKEAKETETDSRVTFQLELDSRVAVDTTWDNDYEDVVEGTQIAALELTYRRSETVRFAVGLRGRYHFGRRRTAPPPETGEKASRFELDVAPTAGYADMTLADGVHLRAGYQEISIGRFDFLSGTNFLAIADLRDGPATIPGASEIAQPALRLDWDLTSWLTAQAFYVPFYQPHVLSIYGTDYALLNPKFDVWIDEQAQSSDPNIQQLAAFLRRSRNRDALRQLSVSAFKALAPEPDLSKPQAALRLTARATGFELGLTVEAVRTHYPVLADTRFQDLVAGTKALDDFITDKPFQVFSLDGATEIGAVQVGFEATYLRNWIQYTIPKPNSGPNVLPGPGVPVNLLHGGLRAEYVESDLQVAIEGMGEYTLTDTPDSSRLWAGLENDHWYAAGAAALRWTPGSGKLSLEGFGMAFTGPTLILGPRLEYAVAENLSLELGAIFVEGPAGVHYGDRKQTIGTVYDQNDQVYTGLRWLP